MHDPAHCKSPCLVGNVCYLVEQRRGSGQEENLPEVHPKGEREEQKVAENTETFKVAVMLDESLTDCWFLAKQPPQTNANMHFRMDCCTEGVLHLVPAQKLLMS